MKKFYFMAAIVGFLSFAAASASAETTVNTSTSDSDVKVTSKNGKSTVCINGKCTTYDGNVEVKTDNGKTSVKVKNTSEGGTTNLPAVDKEVEKQKEAVQKKVDEAKKKQQEFQEKMQKPFDLWFWIQGEIEALKRLFPFFPL